jgi:hypothetical protein
MANDERSLPDKSIDHTLLSADVYFDLDAAPTGRALGHRQDEEEVEFKAEEREPDQDFHVEEPSLPPHPTRYPYNVRPYPPTIHRDPDYARGDDTVSELSLDQYSKAPPQAIELEYVDGVDLGGFYMKDTPRTIPMGYLEGMEVTAWKCSDGIDSTASKRRKCSIGHLCFIFACVLLTITAVLIPIGIIRAGGNESVSSSSGLSSVGGDENSSTVDSPVPSSSPTESPSVRLDTENTPSPTESPTQTTSNSLVTKNPTSSPTVAVTDPPSTTPSSSPSTNEPTSEPTMGETPVPTDSPIIELTEAPTVRQEEDTASPTGTPTVPQDEDTPSPTVTDTESSTTLSPTSPDIDDSSTLEPTGCIDMVEMSQTCYDSGSGTTIRISYENCNPVVGDWIGMYSNPDEINPLELEEPDVWIYTCGDRDCFDLYEFGNVRFSFGSSLPEGPYGAYLVREGTAPPYASFAMTTFVVSSNCEE